MLTHAMSSSCCDRFAPLSSWPNAERDESLHCKIFSRLRSMDARRIVRGGGKLSHHSGARYWPAIYSIPSQCALRDLDMGRSHSHSVSDRTSISVEQAGLGACSVRAFRLLRRALSFPQRAPRHVRSFPSPRTAPLPGIDAEATILGRD